MVPSPSHPLQQSAESQRTELLNRFQQIHGQMNEQIALMQAQVGELNNAIKGTAHQELKTAWPT